MFKSILCYSCRGHDWTVNKLLWADKKHEIRFLESGDFALGCDCCDEEILESIKSEVEALNSEHIKSFFDGVSILFYGRFLECAKCGSEEFVLNE